MSAILKAGDGASRPGLRIDGRASEDDPALCCLAVRALDCDGLPLAHQRQFRSIDRYLYPDGGEVHDREYLLVGRYQFPARDLAIGHAAGDRRTPLKPAHGVRVLLWPSLDSRIGEPEVNATRLGRLHRDLGRRSPGDRGEEIPAGT